MSTQAQQRIMIDATAPEAPLPHFWEEMFGSGRAILALRESYRDDLREVKKATGFQYVRFHNILHDEVGVYDEDDQGKPIYNFTYVDQIYDGLLKNGVRPVVEISFMPKKLASDPNALHPFWYKQNVSPPKDYAKWDDLIRHFAQHLVDRYGLGEVSQWYFEVWNEPNIDFWAGNPKQPTYFELYDHTARALKTVSPLLRVGGPSTAAADWVDAFLAHCAKQNVPVDFVSSHGYADDTVENLFHTSEQIPMNQRVCRAIGKVRGQIKESPFPKLPLFWTEWNVRGDHELRDTTYVASALAYDIAQCDGLVDMMSYWTFDDVFEEGGVPADPMHGGFGLIAVGRYQEAQLLRIFAPAQTRHRAVEQPRLRRSRYSSCRRHAGRGRMEPGGARGKGGFQARATAVSKLEPGGDGADQPGGRLSRKHARRLPENGKPTVSNSGAGREDQSRGRVAAAGGGSIEERRNRD